MITCYGLSISHTDVRRKRKITKSSMIYSSKEKYDLISGMANIFLGLGTVLLLFHLLAPLFGGRLLINALVIYSSWIGFAFCMKYEARRIKRKEKRHLKTHLPMLAYGLFCMGIWISYPYNIGAMLFFLIVSVVAHKAEENESKLEENA